MKGFNRICACIVGLVFLVAGLLKLMDPVGARLVLQDYFAFFHIGFLRSAAGLFAVIFALAESMIGAALITGVWRRIVALVSGCLLAFFTLLTLIILIANPAMDCGCFGQAIKLSHGATFVKNLLLCGIWGLAFLPLRDYGQPQRVKFVSFSIAGISILLFTLYSCLSIPLADYASFKPGTELEQVTETPLSFYDASGNYVDELALEGKVMIVSVPRPDKLGAGNLKRMSAFVRRASAAGFRTILLAASAPGEIENELAAPDLLGMTYFADPRLLLTLNRSNGGVSYISDGQVIAKWAAGSRPDAATLAELQAADPLETLVRTKNSGKLKFQAFLLYVSAVILLL